MQYFNKPTNIHKIPTSVAMHHLSLQNKCPSTFAEFHHQAVEMNFLDTTATILCLETEINLPMMH